MTPSLATFMPPAVCLAFLSPLWSVTVPWMAQLRDGDIVFQTSRSSQSRAVQRATNSRYSHMGIIFIRNGRPYVFEAVATVRYTPVGEWVARGEGRHFVVKRLADAKRVLTPGALRRMRWAASKFEGRPYDLQFGWSNRRMYCSELVWKLYAPLGIELSRPRRVGDFNLGDAVVRRKARERYPDGIPLDEPAVAPSDIFDSRLLQTVVHR